jgi:hypothetical protein
MCLLLFVLEIYKNFFKSQEISSSLALKHLLEGVSNSVPQAFVEHPFYQLSPWQHFSSSFTGSKALTNSLDKAMLGGGKALFWEKQRKCGS